MLLNKIGTALLGVIALFGAILFGWLAVVANSQNDLFGLIVNAGGSVCLWGLMTRCVRYVCGLQGAENESNRWSM